MNINTNNMLTATDRKIITAVLSDYRELCVDSAGDVNIMGLTFEEDKSIEMCRDTRLWKTVDDIIHRVQLNQMLQSDYDVIYRCFDDAIDQFDSTDSGCGCIQCEDDRTAVVGIIYKLQRHTKVSYLFTKEEMVPVVADALVGAIGADALTIDDEVWQKIKAYGTTLGMSEFTMLYVWALVLTGQRHIEDSNGQNKVFDEMANIMRVLGIKVDAE